MSEAEKVCTCSPYKGFFRLCAVHPKGPPGQPKPGKGKMGRPSTDLDLALLENLCRLPLRAEDIGECMRVSVDTISRRIKDGMGMTFAEYLDQKRAQLRWSLMNKQVNLALSGDRTMLIWLGKQWLDQKDRMEQSGTQRHLVGNIPSGRLAEMSDEELDERIEKLFNKVMGKKAPKK